ELAAVEAGQEARGLDLGPQLRQHPCHVHPLAAGRLADRGDPVQTARHRRRFRGEDAVDSRVRCERYEVHRSRPGASSRLRPAATSRCCQAWLRPLSLMKRSIADNGANLASVLRPTLPWSATTTALLE